MKWKPITYEEATPIYDRRPDIWVDTFNLARVRVAIQIVRREWKKRPSGQTKERFCIWLLSWLNDQRRLGFPHPLHWEITRAAKDMMEKKTGEMMYAEVMRTVGQRAIHKVKYGGGKDWRT